MDNDLKTLATGKNFAALTTLSADGQPRTHIMWVDADDEHLLINTEVHRAKFKDIERDPRVTVTVINQENPYQYVEARGRVVDTTTGSDAKVHIDSLAKKYMDVDTYPADIQKIHENNL